MKTLKVPLMMALIEVIVVPCFAHLLIPLSLLPSWRSAHVPDPVSPAHRLFFVPPGAPASIPVTGAMASFHRADHTIVPATLQSWPRHVLPRTAFCPAPQMPRTWIYTDVQLTQAIYACRRKRLFPDIFQAARRRFLSLIILTFWPPSNRFLTVFPATWASLSRAGHLAADGFSNSGFSTAVSRQRSGDERRHIEPLTIKNQRPSLAA